ncbi:TPA: DNA adenine methylase [Yersinia enterocolitica]|nr:DNA adenine methylase [Yersinia enterocolitica]HEN3569415.1 DNA adenine methylase [Yersinia enterocolitica]HEN3651195.1 DNA adenine methylase [Yersinia enterocolitica]HEN3667380.1 DNA adenine methylase [Yersinia enterocolitica]
MRFSTPLRYPGGKGKLTNFIKLVIKNNGLSGCSYVEPYAGGSGVALRLLFDGCVSSIHLNDLNQSIYAFWYSVLHHNDELCQKIEAIPVTMDEWHRQRAVQAQAATVSKLELGFSTFFLNRTNRSGIIGGGVIGGKHQAGDWKLDVRFNKIALIARIRKIAEYSDKIHIYNLDAVNVIKNVIPSIDGDALIYLDPPYYIKGQGLYQNYYQHEDHEEIANLVINDISKHWIVSYDAEPEIIAMYPEQKKIVYGLHYSAQKKHIGSEVMFFSGSLQIPDVDNPSKVRSK